MILDKRYIFSFDVETDSLYGEAFAYGVSVWDTVSEKTVRFSGGYAELDSVKDEWVIENIVKPIFGNQGALRSYKRYDSKREMRDAFWDLYTQYSNDAIILADFQSPCEAYFIRQCVLDDTRDRMFKAPYPLHDLGTALMMVGQDPDVDRLSFFKEDQLPFVKHDPIDDAYVALRIFVDISKYLYKGDKGMTEKVTITKKDNGELELRNSEINRIDEIDNAVYSCINTLAEKQLDWNMELIGEATEALKEVLERHGITVRHPSIVTDSEGRQYYTE